MIDNEDRHTGGHPGHIGPRGPKGDRGEKGYKGTGVKSYARAAFIGYVIMACGVGYAISETHETEHRTCVIQGRGLKAQKYLVGSLKGIRVLLSPLPGEEKPPKPLPPSVVNAINNLNNNLDEYIAIETKQPRTRTC